MKYVKIKAKNYNEALLQLRMQYGDDAIPISHKYIKEGGFLNSRLFAKDVVELTAGIQEKKKFSRVNKSKSTFDVKVGGDETSNLFTNNNDLMGRKKSLDNLKKFSEKSVDREPINSENKATAVLDKISALKKTAGETAQKLESTKGTDAENVEISRTEYSSLLKFEKEFHEIKGTLDKLLKAQGEPGQNNEPLESLFSEDENLKKYEDILIKNDFDRKECGGILNNIKNSISKEDLKDEYKIEKTLKEFLKSKIVTTGPVKKGIKKKVVMFVGPTGVGKTTSLAKMGANLALKEGKKVAFVTIDTYRIAATEQLKKYAEIMRIPIDVINDQKSFKKVIEKSDAEIILVDTSGRSHKNALKISEIKSYADNVNFDLEKILCLSATTKKNDLSTVIKAFEVVNFDSIMITKTDETSFLGNVVNIADKYNKPISYITTGQEVPNDIAVADAEKIVDLMITETT